jgi:hypothetical protein
MYVCYLNRPHPNECSGSDLDGDTYFVCWDPNLILSQQIKPMNYIPARTVPVDHDVTIEVLLNHILIGFSIYSFCHHN